MNKTITSIFFICFFVFNLFGQEVEKNTRHYDSERLIELRNNSDMNYYDLQAKSSNWLEKIGIWLYGIIKMVGDFLSNYFNIDVDPWIIKLILYGLIIGAIVYLILKMMGANFSTFLSLRKNRVTSTKYEILEENVQEADFDSLIDKARKDSDYGLVIRYRYLQVLQVLTKKEKLEYHIRKTNSEYINEIKSQSFCGNFSEIAHLFEYIWYGDFKATEAHALTMDDLFMELNKKVD